MKQVKQFIDDGEGRAACARLAGMLAEYPDKAEAATELTIRILQEALQQGRIEGVKDFLADMDGRLPPPAAAAIRAALGQRLDRTLPWVETLERLTRERLARECRRAIVLKDLSAAADLGARLLDRAATTDDLEKNAIYLAHALSDMHSDRDRALKVVGLIPRAGGKMAERGGEALARHFAEAIRTGAQKGYDRGEQHWSRQLLETIIELSGNLPGINKLGEPSPEEQAEFQNEVLAIFEAGMAHGRRDDLIDALNVLVEFCPADEQAVKNVAGVEERMFIRLGNRAKLVAVRAMRAAGNDEKIRRALLDLAGSHEGRGRLKLLAGIMGGLGHADFFNYLFKALEATDSKLEETWIVDAISRVDHHKAAATLLARLAHVLKNIGGRDNLARADELLKALARVARSRAINVDQRNAIVTKVVQMTDKSDRVIACYAAERMFVNRPDELDPDLRQWAVRRLVEAMWGQPLAGFGSGGNSANGWRQPMVSALIRLGASMLPAILEAGDKVKSRYSGAMGAFGSVIEAVGDPTAVPLLQTMVRTAMLHDDKTSKSKMLEEKVRDVATGEMKDLERDDVVHALLHAIAETGGEPGTAAILDFADQVMTGRVQSPGDKTTTLLYDVKSQHGKIGVVSQSHSGPAEILGEKELKAVLSDAKGGLFVKKEKRIAAIARLGNARELEVIPILVEALGDKDSMVASAAQVALAEFMHPVPNEKEFSQFWEAALEKPKVLKGAVAERLMNVIRREMPKNPPYDRLFERAVLAIEDEVLAHKLKGAAYREEKLAPPAQDAAEGDKPAGENGKTKKEPDLPISILDKKREYMQARQAWLKSGKKGPPPEMPA